MIRYQKHREMKRFFQRHHMYIKSDFSKFALYSGFSAMSPFYMLFLLYANHLLGSYAIAGLLLSLKFLLGVILQILFSGIKDRAELKYTLSAAEAVSSLGYVFLAIAPLFSGYIMTFLCIGIFFRSMAGALWYGTYNSFIYEDFEENNSEVGSKPYSKIQSIFCIGISLGAVIAATLAGVYSYSAAMLFGAFANGTASIIALSLKGPEKCPKGEDCLTKPEISILHFSRAVKKMFKNEKLRYISFAEIIRMSLVEVFNSFAIPFYKTFMPVTSIGYVEALKAMMASLSFGFSEIVIKKMHFLRAIKTFYIIRALLVILAIVFNSIVSPMMIVFRTLFFGPMMTSVEYIMQQNYTKEERVTMSSSLSILSQVFGMIFIVLLGFVADLCSIQCALMVLIPFYAIPYLLYKKQFRILGKE